MNITRSWISLSLVSDVPGCRGVLYYDAKMNMRLENRDCEAHTPVQHLVLSTVFLRKEAAKCALVTPTVIGDICGAPDIAAGLCYISGTVVRDVVCMPRCLSGPLQPKKDFYDETNERDPLPRDEGVNFMPGYNNGD